MRVLIISLVLATATNLAAQTAIPVGIHGVDTISGPSTVPPDLTFLLRTVPAAIFGVGTAAVVGYTGVMIGMQCGTSCGAYTYNVLLAATIVTGTVATAAGASFFPGRGLCTPRERFQRSLAGAALGLAAGVALINVHPVQHAIFGTIPIGSVMFLRRC